jgi:hypothetical protein
MLKTAMTGFKQTTHTASVENGLRSLLSAVSYKSGFKLDLTNVPVSAFLSTSLASRFTVIAVHLPSRKGTVSDSFLAQFITPATRDNMAALVAARDSIVRSRIETNPLVAKTTEIIRRDQAFHYLCNMAQQLGGLPEPELTVPATFLRVLVANVARMAGLPSRGVRAIDMVIQAAHVLTQKQAFCYYDMGLAMAPDRAETFSFTHLNGLGYFMVADIDAVLWSVEPLQVFGDPDMFWVMSVLFEEHRAAKAPYGPQKLPDGYIRLNGFFEDVLPVERVHNWACYNHLCARIERAAKRINKEPIARMAIDIALGRLANNKCFVLYPGTGTAPGIRINSSNSIHDESGGSIDLHPLVLQVSVRGRLFPPAVTVLLTCLPCSRTATRCMSTRSCGPRASRSPLTTRVASWSGARWTPPGRGLPRSRRSRTSSRRSNSTTR